MGKVILLRKSRPAKSLGASNVRVGSLLSCYSGPLFLPVRALWIEHGRLEITDLV